MQSDLKSRKIILINSLLILIFVLFQATINFFISSYISEKTNQVEESYNKKIEHISTMRHIAHERTLLALSIYLTNDFWQRDEYYMQFTDLAEAFIKERNKLEGLSLEVDELQKLQELYAVIRHTQPLQVNIVKRIMNGESKEVFSDLVIKDLPLEKDLSNAFKNLLQTVNNGYSQQRSRLYNIQTQASFLGMLFSLVVIISIFLVIRRIMFKMESVEHQLVQEKEKLSWDAVHDPLTNVYNRRWLIDYLSAINRYDFAVHSLIYIDLDNFKQINDEYSHDAGDKYLQETVRQISRCIRSNDHISRLGGDEFCIYLGNCKKEKAQFIAECILNKVAEFQVECNQKIIKSNGCSIGLTTFTSEISEFEVVVKQADEAAMKAKQLGKNRIAWYNDE